MTARRSALRRRTAETSVRLSIESDGAPGWRGTTGDPGIDHLWDSFARYAGLGFRVSVTGSDPHHRSEDVALVAGRALRRAIPTTPVRRIGEATVPMDEALVQVVLDVVDRPYYESDLDRRSMVDHVLRSTVTESRVTLHQRTLRSGEPHHVHEATFKAFGRAWRAAIAPAERELSPKGRVEWVEESG